MVGEINVSVANQQVSVDLENIQNKSGTVFLKDGEVKVSKHSAGRAFLAIFSPKVRNENRAGKEALTAALNQKYDLTGFRFERGKVNAKQLTSADQAAQKENKTRCEDNIANLTAKYGAFAQSSIQQLRSSADFANNAVSTDTFCQMSNASELEIKGAKVDLGARLRDENLTGSEVLTELKKFPELESLFDKQNTVGGTIGEHTQDVFDQLDSQKGHYDLAGINTRLGNKTGFENFNAERFMKVVVAFHDIGKGLGNSADQHEHTVGIMKDSMKSMGFSEQQTRLALNLVNNDLMGEWQKGRSNSVGEVRSALRDLAADSGIPAKDYLTMQKLFFISDASAYAPLRDIFMEADASGKLGFKAPDAPTVDGVQAPPSPSRLETLLEPFAKQSGFDVAGLMADHLVNTASAITEGAQPLAMFNADFSDKPYNLYDLTDTIMASKDVMQEIITSMPSTTPEETELKALHQTRFDQAVEMATMATEMKADRWSPSHTQGIIQARLEIRHAGITKDIPQELAPNLLENLRSEDGAVRGEAEVKLHLGDFKGIADIRMPGGVSDRFMELVDAKGGSAKLINATGQIQLASSWSPTSMAVKGYMEKSRSVDTDHYYHATTDQQSSFTRTVEEQYDKFAHAPEEYWEALAMSIDSEDSSGKIDAYLKAYSVTADDTIANRTESTKMFDKSMQYQMAMQMEFLSNMDFPGNDRENHNVVIYRTDLPDVLQFNPGFTADNRTSQMQRGPSESGSFLYPVQVGGSLLTAQKVPYHRITNTFMLAGQHSTSDLQDKTRGAIGGNDLRECTFMSDGLDSTVITTSNNIYARMDPTSVGEIPLLRFNVEDI